MRHFSILALAFSTLAACNTEVAPATDAYEAQDDYGLRATAMGFRTTFESPEGVYDFGRTAKVTNATIAVGEKAAGTVCDARVRFFSMDATGAWQSSVQDCTTPNPFFGETLEARDTEIVSGADTWFPNTTITHDGALVGDDAGPDDAFGASAAILTYSEIAIGAPEHGVSGAVYVFKQDSGFQQSAKITHPGVAEHGGFGSDILAGQGYLVIGDRFDRQFVFEKSASGNWLLVDAPQGEVVAANGDTVLVRPAFGSDLYFYRRANGTWEGTGVLHGANLPYTKWTFDDYAAFAVQPAGGTHPGFVDRYTRVDGELDATVRLGMDHTDLDLALENSWLIVAEAKSFGTTGTGVVHLFDWTEDRTRMENERLCPGGDDAFEPNEGTLEATPATEGTFTVTTTSEDFFALGTVQPGETQNVSLTDGPDADVDLYLWDAAGTQLGSSAGIQDAEQIAWTNTGTEPVEVFARVKLFGTTASCSQYTLSSSREVVEPVEPGTCQADTTYDTYATANSSWDDGLDGDDATWGITTTLDSASKVDWYAFAGVFANEQITATLSFDGDVADLDLCLVGADGTDHGCSIADNPETVVFHNTTTETLDAKLKVEWFGAPTELVCVDYTLTLRFETLEPADPADPADPTDSTDATDSTDTTDETPAE